MTEHRRILITASAITPDADFAGTHTPWTAGDDLAAGEITEISPGVSKVGWYYEVYDGIGDGASPVAPGTTTIDIEYVTRDRIRSNDTFHGGLGEAGVIPQKRKIETEVFRDGVGVIRVTAAANLPASGAIWIFVDSGVKS